MIIILIDKRDLNDNHSHCKRILQNFIEKAQNPMNEETPKKSSGWLTGIFKIAVVALAVNIGWQMFLDPLFFPIFHPKDGANEMGQAMIMFMGDWFGWIPYHLGLTGEGGLLQPLMKFILADQLAVVGTPGGADAFANVFDGGLSFDPL